MLALSPLFPTTYGWPSEELIPQNVQIHCDDISKEVEANIYDSFLDVHTYDDIYPDFAPETSVSSVGLENGDFGHPLLEVKKLNHNASERHRRKKVNDLYAFLRSVLPTSTDQKKKVSIPGTVSRALKYIPELQKEVEMLKRKKEKLSSDLSSKANLRQEGMKNKNCRDSKTETKASIVSSVRVLGANEAVIQLISSSDPMSQRKEIDFVSTVLECLEKEEQGFVLMNATTFRCSGEGTSLSTLHFQVQDDNIIDAERLKEKLCSFHQQLDPSLL